MSFFPDAPWKILLSTVLKLRINTARLIHLLQCLSGVSRKYSFHFKCTNSLDSSKYFQCYTLYHRNIQALWKKTEKEVSTLLIGKENFSQLLVREKHNWVK